MGQPDLRSMDTRRAIAFLENHTLARLPDQQARQDWLEEIEFNPSISSEMIDDLVAGGAAVDRLDARDILHTELLSAKQPHRGQELRAALAERRAPRMRERNRANGVL